MEGCEFKNLKRQWNIGQRAWGMTSSLLCVSVVNGRPGCIQYKLAQAWRAVGRLCGGKKVKVKKMHIPLVGSHQKLVISLTHSVSLETHCRLTSVLYTPYIRKIKRPCGKGKQKDHKKKKEAVMAIFFFCYHYFYYYKLLFAKYKVLSVIQLKSETQINLIFNLGAVCKTHLFSVKHKNTFLGFKKEFVQTQKY